MHVLILHNHHKRFHDMLVIQGKLPSGVASFPQFLMRSELRITHTTSQGLAKTSASLARLPATQEHQKTL